MNKASAMDKASAPDSVSDRALTTMFRYNMLAPGDRVVAAVSGGPDSVCLLTVLCQLRERLGVTLAGVAHVNHKLRGEASEEDERFVAALAARHGVPFYRQTAEISNRGNLEQAARRERLLFFSHLIREGRANRIATGHTRDDQAETVLFRLLRGSGLAGLAGILPVTREGLVRPLLDVTRAQIEGFLCARGIPWREDASNQDRRFARNRIRHDLLPQLAREWNPGIAAALGHLADLAGEEEQWWQTEIAARAEKLLVHTAGSIEIRAEALAVLPRAIARRLIRHIALETGGRPEFDHVEKTLDLAHNERGSGSLEVPGIRVERSMDWVRFTPADELAKPPREAPPVAVEVPGRYHWADAEVCFEVTEKPERSGCVRLKWNGQQVPARLELRGWNAGDHYRPWGRSRDQKIQEMFQEARIPSWKRGFWPIVTKASEIVWVRQFGAAAECAWDGAPGPSLWIWEEKNGPA
jgi:tRNA(Ile)-lysidine synthase